MFCSAAPWVRAKRVAAASAILVACIMSGGSNGYTLAAAEFEPQPGYDDMQLVGIFQDRAGCLVVMSSGGEVYVPAFTKGSVDISEEGEGVSLRIEGSNFLLGDEVSLGGSATVGPSSVGHQITTFSKIFGGQVLTATDLAVAAGLQDTEQIGNVNLVKNALTSDEVEAGINAIRRTLETAIDRMKTDSGDVTVLLVGGGTTFIFDVYFCMSLQQSTAVSLVKFSDNILLTHFSAQCTCTRALWRRIPRALLCQATIPPTSFSYAPSSW